MNLKPIYSYINPYMQRQEIYKDLKNKGGIYLWTNTISNKKYLGSSTNLSRRFGSYFSRAHLELELKTNNSIIYKALLKYDYANFRLDIVEFCDKESIIEREQYYIDNLELEYNTLKIARSLTGFKHSDLSKARMSIARLGRALSEETKIKLYAQPKAIGLKTNNLKTGETAYLPSIRRVAAFIGIHPSHLAKCINKKGFYKGRGYSVTRII